MNATPALVAGLLSALVLACEPAPSAPAKPTWANDVLPILRGNCFGCHSAGVPVCTDSSATACRPKNANDFSSFATASDAATAFDLYITSTKPGMIMPPKPAAPLEDWQIKTIKNWATLLEADKEAAKGSHPHNFPPRVENVRQQVGTLPDGTTGLIVAFDVFDTNDDTIESGDVFDAADAERKSLLKIDRLGRFALYLTGVTEAKQFRFELSDAWESRAYVLPQAVP